MVNRGDNETKGRHDAEQSALWAPLRALAQLRAHLTDTGRGFTLLEVLIALAILASGLVVLIGTTATSSQQASFANTNTRVAQLARSKMTDLEYELLEEGFSDSQERYDGNFREEGLDHLDMRWEAVVDPIEIPEDVKQELMAQVNSQLFGGEDSEGALKGNAAFSAMLPMLIGQVPEMINSIGTKVRRIRLVIRFDFAGSEETFHLTQYVVDEDTAKFNLFEEVGDNMDFDTSELESGGSGGDIDPGGGDQGSGIGPGGNDDEGGGLRRTRD